jgi:hypothetical protein
LDRHFWAMNADCSDPARLVGTRITLASDRDGDLEVYSMDRDGSGVAQVTTNSDVYDADPDWQPLP